MEHGHKLAKLKLAIGKISPKLLEMDQVVHVLEFKTQYKLSISIIIIMIYNDTL